MRIKSFFTTDLFRILCICSICLSTVSYCPNIAYAQLTSKQNKQLEKERNNMYKKKKKELEKEGWKIVGSSKTLEVALLEHYAQIGDGKYELEGAVATCRSINVCRQFAISNAQNEYALMASSDVSGKAENIIQGNAVTGEEIDAFVAAYEKNIKATIGSALKPSYAIVRGDKNAKEYKLFFIVDEEKARLARENAMKATLSQVKIASEIGNQISTFIQDGSFIEQQ